jgi:hypothetical protein
MRAQLRDRPAAGLGNGISVFPADAPDEQALLPRRRHLEFIDLHVLGEGARRIRVSGGRAGALQAFSGNLIPPPAWRG